MSGAVSKLARPSGMRNALLKTIQRNLVGATLFATVCGSSWYYFVALDRKKAYADFHKNFDHDKDFERKLKAGIFQFTGQIEAKLEELESEVKK